VGREFNNQAVVKAYDANGAFVCEEILSLPEFDADGCDLLISRERRVRVAIRFITVRTFDSAGLRRIDWRLRYDHEGSLLPQNETSG
jgi:hypothetical protein